MSISSLSAQLASLHQNSAGSKNAGSSLSTSKRHGDAVGRGMAHSVKHGHAVSTTKHKPSVLYPDSKSASDVPLTTLRENCVSSLRQLAKLTGNVEFVSPKYLQTLAGVHSLQFERGLVTTSENDKIDDLIRSLMSLLSTALGESASSSNSTLCFSSSLHVLEYLLRRYDVHARETCAKLLLTCVLPFHEEPLFGRVLQLVDMASLPEFSFLRPHAAVGAPPPTRTVLAKQASKNDALMKLYSQMAKTATNIHAMECDWQPFQPVRRGISRLVSFAAAVSVEALHIQTTNPKYHGSISESTLRVLLPFVLAACGDNSSNNAYSLGMICSDWRGFGHVLASTISEKCVLSMDAREALATSIVKGVLETERACQQELEINNDACIEMVADGVAALMSVLTVSPKGDTDISKLTMLSTRKNTEEQLLGYSLPVTTYKALIKLKSLDAAVGHLYSDRDLEVAPMVASLIALALSRLSTDSKSIAIIVNLIQNNQLKPLWKDRVLNLVASLSAAVLFTVANLSKEQCTPALVDGAQRILKALKIVYPAGCDAGVAHGVTAICKRNKNDNDIRPRLLEILGISNDELHKSDDMNVDLDSAPLLPPRVALEHADASVRLNAIERLAKETLSVESEGETLEEALLRHFLMEDELNVAVGAGESLVSLLSRRATSVTLAFAEDCLKALQKWTVDPDSPASEERMRAIQVALEIAGHSVFALSTAGVDDDFAFIQKQILRGIIAHFDTLEKDAGRALSKALGVSKKSTKNAENLLLTSEALLDNLRSCWNDEKTPQLPSESSLFQRYLSMYSKVMTDAMKASRRSKSSESLLSDALNTCVLMNQLMKQGDKSKAESLLDYFNTCAEHAKVLDASTLLDVIRKLCKVSENAYDSVSAPVIARLCDEFSSAHAISKLRILMEVALRSESSDDATLRLVALAEKCVTVGEIPASSLIECAIFILALLGHSEQSVRKAALRLIGKARDSMATSETHSYSSIDFLFSSALTNTSSQLIMEGITALPPFLTGIITASNDQLNLTSQLLKLCHQTACSMRSRANKGERWLSFEQGEGGCRAAVLILKALELSGEATAPLLQRYKHAGRDILGVILEENLDDLSKPLIELIHSVSRMFKGVKVVDSASLGSEMVISTGPSTRGTRARSYSVGGSPGVSFVEPYPKEMLSDMLKCLSFQDDSDASAIKRELCSAVVHDVLASPSWGANVFKVMDKGSRKKLLESVLRLWKAESIQGAEEAFMGLELDGKDVADLISTDGVKRPDPASVIFLSDYIHSHSERLRSGTGYANLVSFLFQVLEALSTNAYEDEEEDEAEFARHRLLRVLVGLLSPKSTKVNESSRRKFTKKELTKWASLIVALVGGLDNGSKPKQLRALPLGRPRLHAFSLLTALCSEDPPSIVAVLGPAMLDSIELDSSSSPTARPLDVGLEYRISREVFLSVVPVFFKYAEVAGLSQFDLYSQVLTVAAQMGDEIPKMEICSCMVDAITNMPLAGLDNISPIGCFVAAVVAFDARSNEVSGTNELPAATKFATDVLHLSSPPVQVSSLTQLIGFVYHLLSKISGSNRVNDQRGVPTESIIDDLEDALWSDTKSSKGERHTRRISTALAIMNVVSNSLASTPVMNLVTNGDEQASKLSLCLWQDLLMLQSTCVQGSRVEDDAGNVSDKRFWEDCQQLIDTSLEQLQSLLPAHLFLASAALLIENDSDSELCSRAIRIVSERAAVTDPESPEASLFLDMLPMLAELLGASPESATTEDTEGAMLIQQSVFVAVEIFARSLCLKSTKDNGGRMGGFTDVLKHASNLIKMYSASFEQQDNVVSTIDAPSSQLLCSAALCVSTLVRFLTVRSIPLLPDLLGSLLSVLSAVNQALATDSEQWSASQKNRAAVLQVSTLRVLLAVADTLPQFLGPYLGRLVSPTTLLSPSLGIDDTDQQAAASMTASQLGVSLSKKIPARQFIPSLCKSLPKCSSHRELQALLLMLRESVQQAPRTEVATLRSWLLKALTVAYEFRGTDTNGQTANLVDEANNVLLALVMKLSEAQLRPLYAKLCEWCSDVESETRGSDMAAKRHAFWSMSAMLSSQLRSIFLPCLSAVVTDAVRELERTASRLCDGSSKKKVNGGRKRQRLETPDDIDDLESLDYLKPLLSCLESALHADAIEGGKWIRHDDSQRYHSLLSPLSKLLELRAPTTNVTFQQLVHGDEEPGSVISCLTALALAAGNEQLWKPLNHAVVQACGNESRAQVRKAGVSCLLSLIKALGEEYMVLLPECLPVLSELLEETDEEIAGLAQECVSFGEELLGESLQESLR